MVTANKNASATTVELAHRVYDLMAKDLGPENILPYEENT